MPTLEDRGYHVVRVTDPSGSFLGFVRREFSAILTGNNDRFTEVVNKTQASEKMNKLQITPLEVLVALSSPGRRWGRIGRESSATRPRKLQREEAVGECLCHGLISISYLFPQASRRSMAAGKTEGKVPM
jgi:hypothetical protein